MAEARHRRHESYGATSDAIDTRAICLIRETLASHSGLADFAFAMQGLGSGAISLFGTPSRNKSICHASRREKPSPRLRSPSSTQAPTLRAMQCEARRDGGDYILNGDKTWISNGGIADFYVVFARTGEAEGSTRSQRVHRRCDRSRI